MPSSASPGQRRSWNERGLMICDDDGELTSLDDMDERLVFIERGTV